MVPGPKTGGDMKVAYIRVSTEEQNTARQEEAMEAQDIEKVFIEKISGKNMERPQLKAMLDYVREGDTLVVESYSRLARNTKDLLSIVEELEKKGVAFISLKENIDTSTPQGKLMLTIFAGLAQFERECILERQKGQSPDIIAYADRGSKRIRQKMARMDNHGKNKNVSTTAGARELACFVWGMMTGNIA